MNLGNEEFLALARPTLPRWVDRMNVVFLLDQSDSVSLAARERAYRLYRRRGDSRSAARVATLLGIDNHQFRGDTAIGSGWFRRAHRLLDELPRAPEHGWLWIWEGQIALIVGNDPATARRLGADAAELGRALGSIDIEMTGLGLEGLALVAEGEVATGMARLDEATTAAVAEGLWSWVWRLAAIVLTITRAAWISVFLGLALVGWLSLRRGLLSRGKLLAIGALALAILIAAVPLMVDRLEASAVDSALGERTSLMLVAWEMIKANPMLGVGPGSYRFSIAEYLTPELRDVWRVEVHNHYLLRTAETGLLGGFAFVLLLGAALTQAFKVAASPLPRYRAIGMGLAGGIVALMFEMLWDIWGGFTYNALLWFLFGVIAAARDLASKRAAAAAQAGAR